MNLHVIKEYFTPKSILDVGASTGFFYNLAIKQFPDAYYYLIEGNPECEPHIKELGVDYYIGVFSDSIKSTIFYMDKNNPTSTGNSLYRENTDFFSDENVIRYNCQTCTLDSTLVDKQFDLIKLDVQGSELDIIRGGLQIVSNAKGLLLELSTTEYNQNAPLETEVIEFLKTIGFHEEEELECHYTNSYEVFQRDVLFINKNL